MKEKTASFTGTADPDEIAHFSRLAEQWWDPRGPFGPLHAINPLRIGYIRDHAAAHFGCFSGTKPLASLTLLDIGCGGGLICEPMARLGAYVTGIDASEKNIATAAMHAAQAGLAIDYRCMTAEALVAGHEQGLPHMPTLPTPPSTLHSPPATYDIVLALEIVEHVADVDAFIAACASLAKPGGMVVMSTLNRTAASYALAIVGAEYLLRMIPRGTHDWRKFLRPHELVRVLNRYGVSVKSMTGMVFNPLKGVWRLDEKRLDVNYMLMGYKH